MPRYIQPPEPGSHRYTEREKAEVLAFVDRWEAEHWSGGVLAASKEFGVAAQTIRRWLEKRDRQVS